MNRKRKRIVIALGGNALGNTAEEQIEHVRVASEIIAELAAEGHELIIGHGNGPQIGIINSAMNYASTSGPCTPYMPFPECGAMSQGFIGYHLQQGLQQSLLKRKLGKTVVSVVTQVLVDPKDPAFQNPVKPIGNFFSEQEAKELEQKTGYVFREDAGRGYRRVVASPAPQQIVELGAIRKMVQSGLLVIAVGGGGIPVVEDERGIHGIDAVIDKDKSCSKLAQELKADMLLILTAVDQVYIHFHTSEQKALNEVSVPDIRRYIAQGEFAAGSMLPKMEACVDFVEALPNRTAIITSLERAADALHGKAGTRICSEKTESDYVPFEVDSEMYDINNN